MPPTLLWIEDVLGRTQTPMASRSKCPFPRPRWSLGGGGGPGGV